MGSSSTQVQRLIAKILLVFTALNVPLSALGDNFVDMIWTDSPASQVLLPASHLIVQPNID
jgi:hypothetical protein